MKFNELSKLLNELDKSSSRLEKTEKISQFLKNKSKTDIEKINLILLGNINQSTTDKFGVSDSTVLKSISLVSGYSQNKLIELWKKKGDLGLVAQTVIGKKKQSQLFFDSLSVNEVYDKLKSLSTINGDKSEDRKVKLIANILSNSKVNNTESIEAKFVVRLVLNDLKIGIGNSTIRDSIVWSYLYENINYDSEKKSIEPENREEYNKVISIVQDAFDMRNSWSPILDIIFDEKLISEVKTVVINEDNTTPKIINSSEKRVEKLKKISQIEIRLNTPFHVMLAQKVKNVVDGFEKVGSPCYLDYKYDGFRMEVHKVKDKINLFTRSLDNVTKQFPEIVENIKKYVKSDNCVIDCEAVGFEIATGKYKPFQYISQRIKRKHNIHQLASEYPCELVVFDILYLDDKSLIKESLKTRKNILNQTIDCVDKKIIIAKSIICNNVEDGINFFKSAIENNQEGIMFKKMDSIYKPGSRVGTMIKLKSVMDTLDLAIVGAEWGSGKRAGYFTSFTLACIDLEGNFLTIGKVGTGIKEEASDDSDVTFDKLTKLLKPLVTKTDGKSVTISPKIIFEIEYEELQKSSTYSSGYALRFPRVKQIRVDKPVEQINDMNLILAIANDDDI